MDQMLSLKILSGGEKRDIVSFKGNKYSFRSGCKLYNHRSVMARKERGILVWSAQRNVHILETDSLQNDLQFRLLCLGRKKIIPSKSDFLKRLEGIN